jgi:hypothetical protein
MNPDPRDLGKLEMHAFVAEGQSMDSAAEAAVVVGRDSSRRFLSIPKKSVRMNPDSRDSGKARWRPAADPLP